MKGGPITSPSSMPSFKFSSFLLLLSCTRFCVLLLPCAYGWPQVADFGADETFDVSEFPNIRAVEVTVDDHTEALVLPPWFHSSEVVAMASGFCDTHDIGGKDAVRNIPDFDPHLFERLSDPNQPDAKAMSDCGQLTLALAATAVDDFEPFQRLYRFTQALKAAGRMRDMVERTNALLRRRRGVPWNELPRDHREEKFFAVREILEF